MYSKYMSKPTMLRAAITPAEWKRIRKQAVDRGIPTSQLIALGLRESLLKGAKP